jgi:hypothetical protein
MGFSFALLDYQLFLTTLALFLHLKDYFIRSVHFASTFVVLRVTSGIARPSSEIRREACCSCSSTYSSSLLPTPQTSPTQNNSTIHPTSPGPLTLSSGTLSTCPGSRNTETSLALACGANLRPSHGRNVRSNEKYRSNQSLYFQQGGQ